MCLLFNYVHKINVYWGGLWNYLDLCNIWSYVNMEICWGCVKTHSTCGCHSSLFQHPGQWCNTRAQGRRRGSGNNYHPGSYQGIWSPRRIIISYFNAPLSEYTMVINVVYCVLTHHRNIYHKIIYGLRLYIHYMYCRCTSADCYKWTKSKV